MLRRDEPSDNLEGNTSPRQAQDQEQEASHEEMVENEAEIGENLCC